MKKFICLVISLIVSLSCISCRDYTYVIRVGATITPHAEILEQCIDYVESKGYKLEISIFTDYDYPNRAVEEESLDANFFQHTPYLDNFNLQNKTSLVGVLKVHFEPLGLYKGKLNSLEDNLNNAVIGIPNDESNRARALLLLESIDLINLDSSKGINITQNDITSNPYNIELVEMKSDQLPLRLMDFDFCVINGNYAINSNILDRNIASEDIYGLAANTYANIICVKEKFKDSEKTKILVEALKRPAIKEFINNTYNNVVIGL